LAVAVGVLTVVAPGAAAATAAALCLIALLAATRSHTGPVDLAGKRFHWIVFAWAFVMIRPIGHFTTGRTSLTSVGGVPSVENVIDLSTHAAIAALALWSIRSNGLRLRPLWVVLSLPALALASAAWSIAPNVTLGFSSELIAVYLLAALTAAIHEADPSLGRAVVNRSLRLVVQVVAALCIVGLLFPHQAGSAAVSDPGDTRFTWPGVHPLVATAEIGFALLVTLFGRGEAGFSRRWRVALVVLFGTCLYLGQSRTAFAGLAVSGLFGYWFVSKGGAMARRLAGAAAIGATVFLIVASFGGSITQYLYRGQSQQQVFGLNGRIGLWTLTLHQLHSVGNWLFGYGLGSSRVFLASSVQWAGDAHSAWLELLLSLGLLGLVAALALIATLAVRLLRSAPDAAPASRVLPILFVYVLVMSPAATGFAAPGPEPGLGFALLAFCYAATVTPERAAARAVVKRSARLEGDLRPVAIRPSS
jgi:O-antigen ligase